MDIFFHAWVGPDYLSGGIFGKRIMVLGESHYCDRMDECRVCGDMSKCRKLDFTTDVVRDYLNPNVKRDSWMKTYRKFERSLVNHNTTPEESVKIWNALLFYNYLQVAVSGPRKAGSREAYRAAVEPFFSVLDQYQPDLVVVWGNRLWNNLPCERWMEKK